MHYGGAILPLLARIFTRTPGRKSMSAIRAWAAVHGTRQALALLGATVIASAALSAAVLSGFGIFMFVRPVPVLLLFSAVGGVAVAVAAQLNARLVLPDPARARAARLAWAISWTVAAGLAVGAGRLTSRSVDWSPIVRNILIFAALALTMVVLGYSQLAWLPPVGLTLVAMVFGYSDDGSNPYYWWATVLRNDTSALQLVVSALAYSIVVVVYVVRSSSCEP